MLAYFAFLSISNAFPSWALESRDLLGTWKLQTHSISRNGKEKPVCQNPSGILSYYGNGYTVYAMDCSNRGLKNARYTTGSFDVRESETLIHLIDESKKSGREFKSEELVARIHQDQFTMAKTDGKNTLKWVWKKLK